MAEAMALGTPVVATNWSANAEFMTQETSCMVDYELVPVRKQYQYGEASHRWAEADVDQAAGYLKRLFEDKAYYQQRQKPEGVGLRPISAPRNRPGKCVRGWRRSAASAMMAIYTPHANAMRTKGERIP